MSEQKDMYVLGIETSCDETAAAIVKNGKEIISNVVALKLKAISASEALFRKLLQDIMLNKSLWL